MKITLGFIMAVVLAFGGVLITATESDAGPSVSSVSYSQDDGLTIDFSGLDDGLNVFIIITGAINDGMNGTITNGQFNGDISVDPVSGVWTLNITVRTPLGMPAYTGEQTMTVATLTYEPGTGTGMQKVFYYSVGQEVPLKTPSSLGYSMSGNTFRSWNVDGVDRDPGYNLKINADTIATAIWTTSHTVTIPSETGVYTTNPSGVVSVDDGKNLDFTLTLDDAYSQSRPVVRVGYTVIEATSSVSPTFTYTIRNVTTDVVVTVEPMEKNQWTVQIPTGDGYIIETTDPTIVTHGDDFRFTVAISTGYDGSNMRVMANDDEIDAVGGVYTVTNITTNMRITVEGVVLSTYNVILTPGDGYTINGNDQVTYGTDYEFTVELNTGYTKSTPVVKVNGNETSYIMYDESTHTRSYKVNDVSGQLTIAVEDVQKNKYTVTLESGPNGTITSNVPTTEDIEYGTAITITITPAPGFQLSTLMVGEDDVAQSVVNDTYTLVVDDDKTIVATFSDRTYEINVSIDGTGGEVTPIGTIIAVHGSSKTFTIVADGDKVIDSVIDGNAVSGVGGKASASYTISNITSNHDLVVKFRDAAQYTVTLNSDDKHGDVSITGLNSEGKIVEGRTATLVVDPDLGFKASVKVNGNTIILNDDGTYVLPMGEVTIDVTFSLDIVDDGDEEEIPSKPVTPGTSGNSDDGDNLTVVAIAVAAVVAVVAAIAVVALRKD